MKNKIVKFGRIDPDLWHKAKVQALLEGITVQAWVERAIKERLARG